MRTMRILFFTIVLALAVAAAGQPHANNERGFEADKVYQFGGLDSVNVYNGNVMIRLPIVNNKVSSTLSYNLTLTYNTKVWDYLQEYAYPPIMSALPNRRSNAGVGWLLTMGTLYGPSSQTQTGDPAWVYESPDGTDHIFYGSLHNYGDGGTAAYTRDNSYLRMRTISTTVREIDFPDGQIHKFEAQGLNNIYRLTEMRDRYGNWVRVDYNPYWSTVRCTDWSSAWVVTDSALYGRKTDVCLKNKSYDGTNRPTVNEVVISTVNGGTPARYKLQQDTVTVPRGCQRTHNYGSMTSTFAALSYLELPDTTRFNFTYNGVGSSAWCSDGNLAIMTLPTGGRYEYGYTDYRMPVSHRCGDPWQDGWLAISPGIAIKRKVDENGVTDEWRYQPSNEITYNNYECWDGQEYLGQGMMPPEEHVVWVTSPEKDLTKYFFSVWPGYYNDYQNSPDNGFQVMEYAMPYSRKHPDPTGSGGYLTSEVLDCDAAGENCVEKQKTYVVYERDSVALTEKFDANRRQKRHRVVWTSDNNYYYDVDNNDFDGFGHYRAMTASGTFGNGATKDVTKTTRIEYNPGTDQNGRINNAFAIGAGQPWLLNLYTESKLSSGSTVESKTQTCFDADTGFLKGVRKLRYPASGPGANDVITLFTPDSSGYVGQEDHFGGDLQSVSHITDLCSFYEGSRYRMSHTYTAGETTLSRYHRSTGTRDVFLTTTNQTVDPYTGVITSSQDAAGITTNFAFDFMRRITGVSSLGSASTSYVYKNKGEPGYPWATVLVNVDAAGTTNDSQKKIEYDWLGRVKYETRDLPDGPAKRESRYDAAGRKFEVSEWEITPTHFTKTLYDFMGRVTHIYPPDYSATNYHLTTLSYTGGRQTQRTTPIGFSNSGSVVNETPVTVTEKYDIHNRLIEIQEYDVNTFYGYDLSDRLTSVVQNGWDRMGFSTGSTRTFTYDGRGFMTAESHPESNASTYTNFDAKGHAGKTNKGNVRDVFDLEFEFDDAERLIKTFSRNPYNPNGPFRLTKEFVYDNGNNNGASNGRLVQAIRHNYNPGLGDVVVTESMVYGDTAGRLTSKTTLITNATYGTTYQQYTQGFGYNDLGDQTSMTYPQCQYVGCGTGAITTLSRNYTKGVLKSIPGYLDNITYWPNGLYNTISHNGTTTVVDTQLPDDAGMPRPKSITFGNATSCTSPTITQPADQSIPPNTSTNIIVTTGGSATLTTRWYRGSYGDRSWQVGTGSTLNTGVLSSTTVFWAEVSNSCGQAWTSSVTISMCNSPSLSGPAPQTIPAGTSTVLTVTASGTGPFSYQWYKGTTPVGSNSNSYPTEVLYQDATYKVAVTSACGTTESSPVVVTVTCANPNVAGPDAITVPPNTGTNLSVYATGGLAPYTYQWFIGTTPVGSNSPNHPTGNLSATTTYKVRVTSACNAYTEKTATVTVAAPPSNFAAVSTSATRVDLSWTASSSVSFYEVERKTGTGPFFLAFTPTTNSYPDQSVTAGHAYAYRVRAVHHDGTYSSYTNVDVASTYAFTPIVDGVTTVGAAHLSELRTAVGALRTVANLGAYAWTDPTLQPGVTLVRAIHLTQLRTALSEARAALGMATSFTDPTIVAGVTPVRGTHFREAAAACK